VNAPDVLNRYRGRVEAEMRAALMDRALPIYGMMRYHLGWEDEEGKPVPSAGGKMIRPTLCLLACETFGGDVEGAVPAAAAIELLHNFTLIHDDIEDGSEERHGRPTVWRVWGVPQAINAGDGMFSLARYVMYRLREEGIDAETVLSAARLFDAACLRLCEGQYRDIAFQDRLDVEVDDYLRMIEGKTGALMGASTGIGALLAGLAPPAIARVQQFGTKLGLAFQVRDDVLGIWGEAATGKPVGDDITARKKSYPVVYGLSRAAGSDRERLTAIYRRGEITPEGARDVLSILERTGAREQSEVLADRLMQEAYAELEGLHAHPDRLAELREIGAFVVGRRA
jgi:geranylgeranyl diphosphate synthase type I